MDKKVGARMSRKRRSLKINEAERAALEKMRDKHPIAYLRERASAVLKVSAGESVRAVAEAGLLKRHEPETVSGWLDRYEATGLEGLVIRVGRGRKAIFSPTQPGRGAS
jgi:hypothetical protein